MNKKKQGRPKLNLSDDQIKLAAKLAGIGCNLDQIAHILDVSDATLDRRIKEDKKVSDAIEKGRSFAASKVMNAAYNMAISEKNPFMTTFWLKCQLGWREPKEDSSEEERAWTLNYKP